MFALKNCKKIVSIFVSLVLLLSSVCVVNALDFSEDVMALMNAIPDDEAVEITDPVNKTSSQEFVVNKSVAFSLFLRGLATPAVIESTEEEEMLSLMDLGVQAKACLACDTEEEEVVQTGNFYLPECPLDAELQQYIYDTAIEYGIPVDMMFTIPKYESGYRINAISKTNDYGLYQINICNHKGYAKKCGTENKPLDPYINTKWAATMLKYYINNLKEKYSWETAIDLTLSKYNGGPGSKLRSRYVASYDTAHKEVAQWMTNAGYESLITAY